MPPAEDRDALLAAAGGLTVPRVEAEEPVLVAWWRREGTCETRVQARDGAQEVLHLVNYSDEPQDVRILLPWPVRAQVLSPDQEGRVSLEGRSLHVDLDVYTLLVCERRG